MEWELTSSNSWPASPCSEDRQPERRADQGGAGGVYSGALAVSGIHFLIPEFPDFRIDSKDLEHLQGRVCTHASAGVKHYRLKQAPLSSACARAGEDAYVASNDHF